MTNPPDRPDREPEQPAQGDGAGQPDLGAPGNIQQPDYAQPGYGPGYGPGYSPPQDYGPDVPTPGVVPLRPLGAGAILRGALGHIRTNPGLVLGITAVGVTLSQVVQVAAQLAYDSLELMLAANLLSLAVTLLVYNALNGLQLVSLGRALLGRRVGFSDAWRTIAPRLPGLIGLSLLIGLIIGSIVMVSVVVMVVGLVVGGAGVAVGVVAALVTVLVAIWLAVQWGLATPAYVFEHIGVVKALSRSRDLVRGAWWRVFGILLLVALFPLVVSLVLTLSFGGIPVTGFDPAAPPVPPSLGGLIPMAIGWIIFSTFMVPFGIGVTGLLYVDQRIRRERYDVELARSAAAQG